MKNNMGQPWREFVEELEVISEQAVQYAPTIGTQPTHGFWPKRVGDCRFCGLSEMEVIDGVFVLRKCHRHPESIVWVDESTPFTGNQVKDLLLENEEIRILLASSIAERDLIIAALESERIAATERGDKAVELLREYRRMHEYKDVFEHQNDSETCSTCQKLDASGLLEGK